MVNKTIIAENFSKASGYYDSFCEIQSECAYFLAGILPDIENVKDILEVGCGTGEFTESLLDEYPLASIDAIDLSQKMLDEAAKKIPGEDESRVRFLKGDAENFNLDKKYDIIASNTCMQWFANPALYLRNIRSSIRPGGALCFSMYGPETFKELEEALAYLKKESGLISARSFIDKDGIESVIKESFDEVKGEEIIFEKRYPDLLTALKEIRSLGARGEGLKGRLTLTMNRVSIMEDYLREKYERVKFSHEVFFFLCRT